MDPSVVSAVAFVASAFIHVFPQLAEIRKGGAGHVQKVERRPARSPGATPRCSQRTSSARLDAEYRRALAGGGLTAGLFGLRRFLLPLGTGERRVARSARPDTKSQHRLTSFVVPWGAQPICHGLVLMHRRNFWRRSVGSGTRSR